MIVRLVNDRRLVVFGAINRPLRETDRSDCGLLKSTSRMTSKVRILAVFCTNQIAFIVFSIWLTWYSWRSVFVAVAGTFPASSILLSSCLFSSIHLILPLNEVVASLSYKRGLKQNCASSLSVEAKQ